jgi:hypothetical protein
VVDHVGNEAAWLADASITKQEVYDYLTKNVTHTGLVQASVPLVGVIAKNGGVAPAADAHAIFTDPGGSNDATRQLEIYHGGLLRTVGIPKKHMAWASLPASGDIGEMVYVTDLQITVEYRDAGADAVLSGTALAGWHPVESGLMLCENETGGDIEANRVVALVGTTATRRVAKTTVDFQQNVHGVNLHSATIATGARLIVVLPGYGNPIKMQVDPTVTVDGGAALEITAGDWLITTKATAGTARTRGASQSSGIPAAGQRITGVPAGAFAIALEDRLSGAGAGTIMAKMLPAVGTGAEAQRGAISIYRDESVTDSTSDTVYACRGQNGTNGVQDAVDNEFIDAKHMPIIAVRVRVRLKGTAMAGASEIGVGLDPDSASFAAAQVTLNHITQQGAATATGFEAVALVSTCEDGAGTVAGSSFIYQIAGSNLTSVEHIQFWQTGYIF